MQIERPIEVTIAVPTYRRLELLRALIPALDAQAADAIARCPFVGEVDLLVIDNDPDRTAAGALAEQSADLSVPLRVVGEGVPGVSAVRNTALDQTTGRDVLVFIDDDELPHDGWLVELLETWRAQGADAVAGRVVSRFDRPVDPWIAAGGFFERRSLATGTPIGVAATNNLLLDRRTVARLGLRFDLSLGSSGGEDTVFTRTLTASGGRMVWCDEAVVTDLVPADRMSRSWVLARAYSYGNSAAIADLRLQSAPSRRLVARARWIALGSTRVTVGTARSLFGRATGRVRDDARGRRTARRGAGMVAGAVGSVYHEYGRESDGGTIKVLESFPEPRATTNPYITQLHRALLAEPSIRVTTFSWRAALLSRYDIFHTHWPEILVDGHSAVKKIVRQGLFVGLLLRLRLQSIPVVRTMHNLDLPSGLSRWQRWLLGALDRRVVHRIVLNETTQASTAPRSVILHGDYRDWFADQPSLPTVPGRVTFVGLIRRYKNVTALIAAFRTLPDGLATSLRVCGRPSSEHLLSDLQAAAGSDPRVTIVAEFLDDAGLAKEIHEAEIVVLPYREMHNSGTALLALSLGRPVLVPRNVTTLALADEVGADWVQTYDGDFDAAALATALLAIRAADLAGRVPNLAARSWSTAAEQHLIAFRTARG